MKAHSTVALLVIAAVCTQPACSFLLVEGPPARDEIPFRHSDDTFCTENNRNPVGDIVVAGVIPLYVLMMMVSGQGPSPQSPTERTIWLSSALVSSGIFAASSIWGFYTTHQCRRYTARILGKSAR